MEYGLVAAIGWGVSSVAATHAARRMGTLVALLASQVTGTIVLAAILAAMHPHLLALPGAAVLGLAAAGFLSLVGWLTYYRALEYGPVGIVSGTAATYGGVTALLAMLVLGEPLGVYGGIGDALAVAGVATAAMRVTTAPSDGGWRQAFGGPWAGVSGSRAPRACRAWRAGQAAPQALAGPHARAGLRRHLRDRRLLARHVRRARPAGWSPRLMVDIISVTVLLAAIICKHKRPRRRDRRGRLGDRRRAYRSRCAGRVRPRRAGRPGRHHRRRLQHLPGDPAGRWPAAVPGRLSALQVFGICVAVAGLTLVSMSGRLA